MSQPPTTRQSGVSKTSARLIVSKSRSGRNFVLVHIELAFRERGECRNDGMIAMGCA